jgi:hypothetical protein
MPTDNRLTQAQARARQVRRALIIISLMGTAIWLTACGGPSERELKNRQEFEMLLTAISLKNSRELANDARRLQARHDSGELSEAAHQQIRAIVSVAQTGDWGKAEQQAYEFRERYPYFK